MDQEGGLVRRRRVRVELDPDRPALPGRRVDHDHRLPGTLEIVPRESVEPDRVGGRERLRGVQPRHAHDRGLPRAEAVVQVVGRGVDRRAARVGGHRGVVEGDPPPGRARLVGHRVEVVRERQHALRNAGLGALVERDHAALAGPAEIDRPRPAAGAVAAQAELGRLGPLAVDPDRARLAALHLRLARGAERELHRPLSRRRAARARELGLLRQVERPRGGAQPDPPSREAVHPDLDRPALQDVLLALRDDLHPRLLGLRAGRYESEHDRNTTGGSGECRDRRPS